MKLVSFRGLPLPLTVSGRGGRFGQAIVIHLTRFLDQWIQCAD